jgi:hypothetical protein
MSKAGNRHIRKALFFPAMSAMRFNPICKALAERLKEKGKPSIVIIGAVMTKLLHLIYGVLKAKNPSTPTSSKKHKLPLDFNAASDPNYCPSLATLHSTRRPIPRLLLLS